MNASDAATKKTLGILLLLLAVMGVTSAVNPDFLGDYNLQNVVRWTALFGIPSIGVAFVILTGGIDLSIGSVIGLTGTLLPWLLVQQGWNPVVACLAVLLLSAALGVAHGLLITRLGLQPFVVTLCGLLLYRGIARAITQDQVVGFGSAYPGLRSLATGKVMPFPPLVLAVGLAVSVLLFLRARARGAGGPSGGAVPAPSGEGLHRVLALAAVLWGGFALVTDLPGGGMKTPAPVLMVLGLAFLAAFVLHETVFGRYLFAIGRNEEAARYAGVNTRRVEVAAYGICSALAGLAGVLFALDVNSVQPATQGNFYELYAIAAAVLGGCSLRGGEGTVLGVLLGAALMRVLYNAINLLRIPAQLEFAIIGAVILLGVVADELVQRWVAQRAKASASA